LLKEEGAALSERHWAGRGARVIPLGKTRWNAYDLAFRFKDVGVKQKDNKRARSAGAGDLSCGHLTQNVF